MTETGRLVSRYKLYDKLASGGMATIHLGCALGAVGFARAVVIKRLHKEYATDREFVSMFVDEAHVASRIRHPNVIPMLDVVSEAGELFLVMEYVHGEALGRLIVKHAKSNRPIAPGILASVGIGMAEGLHAAHEATSDKGEPLGIVHRDVSPQNVLVGADGVTRVFDFGIAKAESRLQETNAGAVKGKLAYMAPEQIVGDPLDRRADIWAAGVVLWEAATRRRLFVADRSDAYVEKIFKEEIPPPSRYADVPPAFDRAVLKALSRRREERFATARELAVALEEAIEPENARIVGEWVTETAQAELAQRAELIKHVEGSSTDPNSIRRQIAVLELENAPTEVTPTGPPPPLRRESTPPDALVEARTETSHAVGSRPSLPDRTGPEAAASRRKGYVVPVLALLVGLGAGGAVVWNRTAKHVTAPPLPAPTSADTQTAPSATSAPPPPGTGEAPPPLVSATPSAAASAVAPSKPLAKKPPPHPRDPAHAATAQPPPADTSVDMNNRK